MEGLQQVPGIVKYIKLIPDLLGLMVKSRTQSQHNGLYSSNFPMRGSLSPASTTGPEDSDFSMCHQDTAEEIKGWNY